MKFLGLVNNIQTLRWFPFESCRKNIHHLTQILGSRRDETAQ